MLADNPGLNDDILAVFLQNGLKIFATGVRSFENESVEFYDCAIDIYKGYLSHANVEVQERANIGLQCILQMKEIVLTKPESDFQFLFEGEFELINIYFLIMLFRRIETCGSKSTKEGSNTSRTKS